MREARRSGLLLSPRSRIRGGGFTWRQCSSVCQGRSQVFMAGGAVPAS